MENKEIAVIFETISQLLALRKEERFKIIAYERASRAIEQLPEPVARLAEEGRLAEIRGVGEAMMARIGELLETGRLDYLDRMVEETPAGLAELLKVPGLGPARIAALWEQAGIDSLEALEGACAGGGLAGIKGFGPKTIQKMQDGIARIRERAGKVLLATAVPLADRLAELIRECPAVERCEVAGSIRRGCETVTDLDLVVGSDRPEEVSAWLAELPLVRAVLESGPTRTRLELPGKIGADVRVVSDRQFPAALQHLTGSAAHNVRLRERARSRGLKLNEYGLFDGERPLPVADERELYDRLGLAYVPPELREDAGELEAASAGPLPELVRFEQLRGTFHCHTNASDGIGTLEEMAAAARDLGWQYLGISDHSRTSSFAGGLEIEDLEDQMAEIDALNAAFDDGFRLLKGSEVDILPDGSLDYPDELLGRLDFVIASVHSHFSMPGDEMLERVLAAVRHPLVDFIAHPTGRLLLKREPYGLDLDRVIAEAAATRTLLEINASPRRLDIDAPHARLAATLGILISINPDAHHPGTLRDVRYGVLQARRAGLTAQQVLNTRSWDQIEAILRTRRESAT